GGTVGDVESLPFLESIRQIGNDLSRNNVMYIHLTPVLSMEAAGALKNKPTKKSVKKNLKQSNHPDLLLCRSENEIPADVKRKIAAFCNLKEHMVISAPDVDTIYQAPVTYHEQGLDEAVCKFFDIKTAAPDLSRWHRFLRAYRNPID